MTGVLIRKKPGQRHTQREDEYVKMEERLSYAPTA